MRKSRKQGLFALACIAVGVYLFAVHRNGTTAFYPSMVGRVGHARAEPGWRRGKLDSSIVEALMRLLPETFDGRCADVMNTSYGRGIKLSASYQRGIKLMDEKVRAIGEHATKEGYIVQKPEVTFLNHMVKMAHVKTVCETGFNLGYSAFNYLSAKRSVIVHSFDLGRWMGTKVMVRHLEEHFKDRLFVHFGDSVQTIPEFAAANPDVRCDLVLVDGGHFVNVATADLENFRRMSVPGRTVVVIDDHPTTWAIKELAPAWEAATMNGIIHELFKCSDLFLEKSAQKAYYATGFAVGIFT